MAEFKGEIKVAARIIDYISSGLYASPAACLKELVNNSYDADASRVDLFVKPDTETIVVSDDGIGMSQKEFVRHFDRVSESHKRDDSGSTPEGRAKIGKIGIGFIAANELCDVMEIVSTKAGSKALLTVDVNFADMRIDAGERRVSGTDAIVKGDYAGAVTQTAEPDDHFTHVFLKEVRTPADQILAGARDRRHTAGKLSIYGLPPSAVRELIESEGVSEWGAFDEYSSAMLQVGLNVPVRYLPDWYPAEHGAVLERLEQEVAKLGFSVFVDGSDLRKPVVLEPGERNLLKPIKIAGDEVSATGYFYAKRKVLEPRWLNGLLIRIRNAAVGEYDNTFLNFKQSEGALFQDWTTSEVWANDQLEEALNIDRRTLRTTHPAFVEFQECYHDLLSDFLADVRKRLYSEPASERRFKQASEEVQRFADVIESTTLPPRIRRELKESVSRRRPKDKRDVSHVLRKFSVAELYDVVLDVAREQLPPAEFAQFARALAERLLR